MRPDETSRGDGCCRHFYLVSDGAEEQAPGEAIAFALSLAIRNSRRILFICQDNGCEGMRVFKRMITSANLNELCHGREVELLMGVRARALSLQGLANGGAQTFGGIVFGVQLRPEAFAALDALAKGEAVIHLATCESDIAEWAERTAAVEIPTRSRIAARFGFQI